MNQMQNWLESNCDMSLQVGTKPTLKNCDRLTWPVAQLHASKRICEEAYPEQAWQYKSDRTIFHNNCSQKFLCSRILLTSTPAYSQINPNNTLEAESSCFIQNISINFVN